MTFRNQIAGLVRFSYPALSGFASQGQDPAALAAALYDPARLEARFHLFERLTVPSLVAQSDGDFDLAVLTGEGFPAMERLCGALAPLPRARVIRLPPMFHYPATQSVFDQLRDPGASHLTSFRIDDDDAVDRDLIARLRRNAAALSAMSGGKSPVAIGFNRGFFLRLSGQGNTVFDVVEKLPLGIGLALCAPAGGRANIFARNHRLLPQFFHCWTDAETPAFIRTVHAGNDSAAHVSGRRGTMAEPAVAAAIARHFPFSLAGLLAI